MILLPELSQLLVAAVAWLAIASLKTIPLIIFVFIIQRLFRKHLSAAAHYCLWLGVLISLAIPVGWDMQLGQLPGTIFPVTPVEQNTLSSSSPDITVAAAVALEMNPRELLPAPTNSGVDSGINLLREHYRLALAIIWLCGVLALSTITLTSVVFFHRIKKNASPVAADFLRLLNDCKAELQLNKSIQLLSSPEIQSPITLGWLRPAIVLPENIEQQFTPTTIKHVLLHELGHIKRQDIFCNWAACSINILHWFNPFVWLACRKMRMDMEVACDALVLAHLPLAQHKNYGATLVAISEVPRVSRRAITTLGILENHTELKERLTMIKEFSTMKIKSKVFLSVILIATAITSLAQPGLESSANHSLPTTNQSPDASNITVKEFAARAEKDLKVNVLVGQKDADTKIRINIGAAPLNYGQMLTQLKINDFTAYKSKDYIQIIPMRDARSVNIPVVEKGKTYFEDEVVTDSIKTEKACVATIVAATRPLIPQNGHLTAYEDGRTLIISDTYGNVQRIRNIIKSLENNMDHPEDCKYVKLPEEQPQNKITK